MTGGTLTLLALFVRPVDDDSVAAVRFLPFLPSFDCDLEKLCGRGLAKFRRRDGNNKKNVFPFSRQKRTSHTRT